MLEYQDCIKNLFEKVSQLYIKLPVFLEPFLLPDRIESYFNYCRRFEEECILKNACFMFNITKRFKATVSLR
jgi:hypothetical protein